MTARTLITHFPYTNSPPNLSFTPPASTSGRSPVSQEFFWDNIPRRGDVPGENGKMGSATQRQTFDVAGEIATLRNQVSAYREELEKGFASQVTLLTEQIEDLRAKQNCHRDQINDRSIELGRLACTMKDQAAVLDSLVSTVREQASRLNSADIRNGHLKEQMQNIQNAQKECYSRLRIQISSSIGTDANADKFVDQALAIESLEKRIQMLEAKRNEDLARIEDQARTIEELNIRISQIGNNQASSISSLTSLKKRIEESEKVLKFYSSMNVADRLARSELAIADLTRSTQSLHFSYHSLSYARQARLFP